MPSFCPHPFLSESNIIRTDINSVDKSPSRDANNCSADRESIRLLWNLEDHYRVHNSPLLDPTPSQMNSVHVLISYFFKIDFNIDNVSLCFPIDLFFSVFRIKLLYAFLISMRVTCLAYLILLDLITLIIPKVVRSTNYEIPNATFSSYCKAYFLSQIQLFSSTGCSQTSSMYVLPQAQRPSFTPIQNNR
jgi:hypothetical protein